MAMGLPRRFLNLIVNDVRGSSIKSSLRCVDLNQLFHPDTSPPGTLTMETIQLPSRTFGFKAWPSGCHPLTDRKVLCTEGHKRAFLFDADTGQVVTMPTPTLTSTWQPKSMFKRKLMLKPISLFVPSASGGDDPDCSLFLMNPYPKQEPISGRPESDHQFMAFVYGTSKTSPSKSWSWRSLPLPPYLTDPWYRHRCTKIMSYGIVGGGSHICISASGAGTYCMDTVTYTWSKVGEWMLPFRGKVEYVPELKLWFGLSDSDENQRLVAADLSAMDSGPELVGTWKEFDDTPCDFRQRGDSRLVYLGSGRFCITKLLTLGSFRTGYEHFTVFTGVEVMPLVHDGCCSGSGGRDGGRVELRVIKHQSRCMLNDTYFIKAVF